jgi:hypothetical protein
MYKVMSSNLSHVKLKTLRQIMNAPSPTVRYLEARIMDISDITYKTEVPCPGRSWHIHVKEPLKSHLHMYIALSVGQTLQPLTGSADVTVYMKYSQQDNKQ